jgi:hypothetical protein
LSAKVIRRIIPRSVQARTEEFTAFWFIIVKGLTAITTTVRSTQHRHATLNY